MSLDRRRLFLGASALAAAGVAFVARAPQARAQSVIPSAPESRASGATWQNVKDYGARGDNSSDDGPAFQAAFDYLAAHGGTLEIPPGQYVIQTPVVMECGVFAPSIIIFGHGSASIIRPDVGPDRDCLTISNGGEPGAYTCVRNLAFGPRGAGPSAGPVGCRDLIKILANSFSKVRLEDLVFVGVACRLSHVHVIGGQFSLEHFLMHAAVSADSFAIVYAQSCDTVYIAHGSFADSGTLNGDRRTGAFCSYYVLLEPTIDANSPGTGHITATTPYEINDVITGPAAIIQFFCYSYSNGGNSRGDRILFRNIRCNASSTGGSTAIYVFNWAKVLIESCAAGYAGWETDFVNLAYVGSADIRSCTTEGAHPSANRIVANSGCGVLNVYECDHVVIKSQAACTLVEKLGAKTKQLVGQDSVVLY